LSAEAVTFAGMRSDVAASMTAFDVFALASLTEGISLTLLEAAAAGLPIVATRVGGNPEVVIDQETGLLVPPAQPTQLAAALRDLAGRADRRAMGLRGRARVEARFSEDGMVRHYEALYADVLGLVSETPGRLDADRRHGVPGTPSSLGPPGPRAARRLVTL
jgi:glycosyltransferase involved in cell wall biosynthesis